MKLYRAITKQAFEKTQGIVPRQYTSRFPSNVPYVVDNLWEHLRPASMPSRRHAIYASPSPAQALASASSGVDGSEYVVCEVVFEPERMKAAHLNVVDARYHQDIRSISQFVSRCSQRLAEEAEIGSFSLVNAAIFAPGLGTPMNPATVDQISATMSFAADLLVHAQANCTLWADAAPSPQHGDGELFFEITDGDHFILLPM